MDIGTAPGDDRGTVEAAHRRARTHLVRGDPVAALGCADDVVEALERLGHVRLSACDAAIRADVAATRGQYAEAVRQGRRGLDLAARIGDPAGAAGAWLPLLRALVATGRDEDSARTRDEGLRVVDTRSGALGAAVVASAGPPDDATAAAHAALHQDGLSPAGGAEAGLLLATAGLRDGDLPAARAAVGAATEAAAGVGHRTLLTAARLVSAATDRAAGDDVAARAHDLLADAGRLGQCPLVADALDLLAAVHRDADRGVTAARLHAAAARMRRGMGAVAGPLARVLAPPDGWASDPALAAAWSEGTELGDDGGMRAIGFAQRTRGRRGRPRTGWDSLTPTEREVVAEVAAGLSNAQIGARLLVSPGTVRTHLRSVFAKLGVTSRAELAARVGARDGAVRQLEGG